MKVILNNKAVRLLLICMVGIVILGLGYDLWQQWYVRREGMTLGLLTGTPCAPPCWQGFSPGTILEKATLVRQLRRMPGVGEVWERELQTSTGGIVINWFWNKNPLLNLFSPPWPGYNSIYLSDTGLLNGITLSVDFELTVAELIDKYGIPEATGPVVTGTPKPSSGSMNFFYPQYGLICRVEVLPDYQPVLDPNSIVYEVVYQLKNFELDPKFKQPWPGYGELEISGP